MNGSQWRFALTSLVLALISLVPSCAHDQQLVSIEIQPDTDTFGATNIPVAADAGLSVQLRALGHYIHPPVTKDITDQATWGSNDIQMVTVTSTGLAVVTGLSCGATLISATVNTNTDASSRPSSGAIITGFTTANVTCFTGTNTGPPLTVNFTGAGSGTINSSPSELGCASSCTGNFAAGAVITLTATPNVGSTFGSWVGCDSVSGTVCTLTLTGARTVTVQFN
jgi:Divergent InlB B-repeat domain/Bacterial Ig-like domain (group 2)